MTSKDLLDTLDNLKHAEKLEEFFDNLPAVINSDPAILCQELFKHIVDYAMGQNNKDVIDSARFCLSELLNMNFRHLITAEILEQAITAWRKVMPTYYGGEHETETITLLLTCAPGLLTPTMAQAFIKDFEFCRNGVGCFSNSCDHESRRPLQFLQVVVDIRFDLVTDEIIDALLVAQASVEYANTDRHDPDDPDDKNHYAEAAEARARLDALLESISFKLDTTRLQGYTPVMKAFATLQKMKAVSK